MKSTRYFSFFLIIFLWSIGLIAFSTKIYADTNFTYFVSPGGNDSSIGNNESSPFRTINHALALAEPGDVIRLMEGEYYQDIKTIRAGHSEYPIKIVGTSNATVRGTGKTVIADIQHSYVELINFTINGLVGGGYKSEDYRKKLVYIKGLTGIGIQNVKLYNMKLLNARDECVRLKYFAHYIEISNSRISYCGMQDYKFNDGGHNGEAIYIGTAPEQLGKNPTSDRDQSNHNWIHHNALEPFGSECVDIKEGSQFNTIEFNQCSHAKDMNLGGFSIRGNQNIIRYNAIYNNSGAGVRLGGDEVSDGINNDVYGNQLNENQYSALKIMAEPQGKICDNFIVLNEDQQAIRGKKGLLKETYLQPCFDNYQSLLFEL